MQKNPHKLVKNLGEIPMTKTEAERRALYRLCVRARTGRSPEQIANEKSLTKWTRKRRAWDEHDDLILRIFAKVDSRKKLALVLSRTLFAIQHRIKKLRAEGKL